MRERNRQGHQFRCIIAGKTKHEPLIASANVFAGIGIRINTLCDIRTLRVDLLDKLTGIRVKTEFLVGIANFPNHITNNVFVIDVCFGCNLTSDDYKSSCHHCFTRHS